MSNTNRRHLTKTFDVPADGRPAAPGKHYFYGPVDGDNRLRLFEVDTKYELQEIIGEGRYGTVCSGVNTETKEEVAVKKMDDVISLGLPFAKRALREIRLLRKIDHPNFIKIKDVMVTSTSPSFDEVYMVQERMNFDLSSVLDRFHVSECQCRQIFFQILRGLEYLHAGNVLHRDLKPQNILLDNRAGVKICDFGLARTANEILMTSCVAGACYRAPELFLHMLSSTDVSSYDQGVDIWAAACIFAQLLGGGDRVPLFVAKSEADMIVAIAEIIPKPKDDDLDFIHNV